MEPSGSSTVFMLARPMLSDGAGFQLGVDCEASIDSALARAGWTPSASGVWVRS